MALALNEVAVAGAVEVEGFFFFFLSPQVHMSGRHMKVWSSEERSELETN